MMPTAPSQPPGIRAFWKRHYHLLAQFAGRAVAVQTRGSFLGMLWWLLDPFLNLTLYSIVFGLFMRGHRGRLDELGPFAFPIFIFVGLTLLGVINETLGQSPHAVLGRASLVKKVVFPLPLLTLADLAPTALRAVLGGVITIVAVLATGIGFSWQWFLLPLVVIPAFLIALGGGWILAGVGVYFRDSQYIIRFFTNLLFYCSAVFYDEDVIRKLPPLWNVLKFNPILQLIDEARKILLFHDPVNWTVIGLLNVGGAVFAWIGYKAFTSLSKGFADVL